VTRTTSDPPATSSESRPRHGLLRSFYFAFAGLWFLLSTQRNARIHIGVAALACALGAWLRISRVEWAIIICAIAGVLILEGLNTAIEAAVDLASPDIHPLAKHAKDLSAGMVLIAAIGSALIGLIILGPPLWARLGL
jgi:diacylglycerol kinase